MYYSNDIQEVLLSAEDMLKHVKKTAAAISEDYKGKEIYLIAILKGATVFMADLVRYIDCPLKMDFMAVTSYGNSTKTSGVVKITKDIDADLTDKHVLIVEDIIDTGVTLSHLTKLLKTREPASINICAALDKPSRRKTDLQVKYKGIEIPDRFVVGYGLDYASLYRNLPDVCVLKPEIYTK